MADPDPKAPPAGDAKPLTAAQAAKAVKRLVPKVDKKGQSDGFESVPVRADEVLAFRDYGTHVVVVTNDGQKFSSAQAA